ncbi:MAG: hypothetical protein J1E38_09035 [Paramuribaculum sp.]|nr:hypothetical protein [Paramuribaculum sp.]
MKKILQIFSIIALFASCNKNETILQSAVDQANKLCPMTVDEITTLEYVKYYPGDTILTYDYVINEEKCPITLISANLETLGETMKSNLNSPATKILTDACSNAGVLIKFSYRGDQSKESCAVVYDPKTGKTEYEPIE